MRYFVRKVRTLHQLDAAGRRKLVQRLAGFGAVGVFNTLLGITLQYLFLKVLGTPKYLTYVGLYTFGVLLGYQLNARFVFQAQRSHQGLLRFALVYGGSLLLGLVLIWAFERLLPLPGIDPKTRDFLHVLLTLPFTMVWNFAGTAVVMRKK